VFIISISSLWDSIFSTSSLLFDTFSAIYYVFNAFVEYFKNAIIMIGDFLSGLISISTSFFSFVPREFMAFIMTGLSLMLLAIILKFILPLLTAFIGGFKK